MFRACRTLLNNLTNSSFGLLLLTSCLLYLLSILSNLRHLNSSRSPEWSTPGSIVGGRLWPELGSWPSSETTCKTDAAWETTSSFALPTNKCLGSTHPNDVVSERDLTQSGDATDAALKSSGEADLSASENGLRERSKYLKVLCPLTSATFSTAAFHLYSVASNMP